jgi:hypothetical protein
MRVRISAMSTTWKMDQMKKDSKERSRRTVKTT